LPDNPQTIKEKLQACLDNYDVILLSGGVSMGKFDYVPQALEGLGIVKLFHKVRQRPGKPFWFGVHSSGTVVFAFPGNPVSTFACMVRYFIPWLANCLGLAAAKYYAVLAAHVACPPNLQCFIPVQLSTSNGGVLMAAPITGNGSGDFAGLVLANAFIELPAGQEVYKMGEVYPIWPFKNMFNAG
jgi:molybdopterin molybdotransferase